MKVLKIVCIVFLVLIVVLTVTVLIVYSESKVAVLNYHNVMTEEEMSNVEEEKNMWCISVENFEEEMKFLHDFGYKCLTMEEFAKWKDGELNVPFRSVLVTFDDGLLSNYQYAIPILNKYNINATIFVIGEVSEGTDNEWNEWEGIADSYMSMEKIKEIREKYHNVEFYSHTYGLHNKENGIPLVNIRTEEQLEEDINNFKNLMGETKYIAYPYGITNDTYVNKLKHHGYKYGFLLGENKKATRKDDNFHINRINVSKNKDMFHFIGRLLLPY